MTGDSERSGLPITHFTDQAALEAWLATQPADAKGIWLAIAKAGGGATSVGKAEAIDSALCFGWIDGQLGKLDERHFLIRFTPRRPRSKWSENDARRAEELLAEGRVRPGGVAQIEAAKADGRWEAAYPPASRIAVPEDLAAALARRPPAKSFFDGLSGANRYAVLYRLHAVTERAKRKVAVAKWVAALARGETVHG
ncbi:MULTISPECIES: YdeI/OmpD-associated family protein [Sphingomonas]|uniref:YdeI/OmpD-associated family protein n=1 Tax=Sphingomonas TaxID=13687 RepID=UPI001F0727E3|nr:MULTISPECIES: YdeI/OmpD-associated family protein [Sphingomonas]